MSNKYLAASTAVLSSKKGIFSEFLFRPWHLSLHLREYNGAKKYLVSHQLCKFSHLKRWERPVIFIIGIPQLWETK